MTEVIPDRTAMIAGLAAKRSEIDRRIKDAQRLIVELVADLDHVDATILAFDPKISSKPPPEKQFPTVHPAFKGEMRRFVLAALREAPAPVTSLEITQKVFAWKGLPSDNRQVVMLVRKRVSASLWKLMQKGVVRKIPQAAEYDAWELNAR